MVSVGRILRDYRDAGSVNGLLALWGFVDDTTFLTKAGHVGVVYRLRGVDYEGLSHPQRQALAHRFEAALRLLDEHCRVYQYLLKRTVGPFVAAPCDAPIANEAIQRRAAYLNGRRQDLFDLSLYLVLLYEAPHVVQTKHASFAGSGRRPREALRAWLSTDQALQLLESELDRAIGTLHHKAQAFEVQIGEFGPARLREAGGVPVLPRARELHPGRRRRRAAHVRHASRLLRLRFGRGLPPRSPRWSATATSRC